MPVLGIDPGSQKCGYAVVARLGEPALERGIVRIEELAQTARLLVERHTVTAIALGTGTKSGAVRAILKVLGVPVTLVDERATTYLARARYFEAYPPKGWRRLIPRGMLLPPRPIDDFAAELIAERFLRMQPAS